MLKFSRILRKCRSLSVSSATSRQTRTFHAARFANKQPEPVSPAEFRTYFQRCTQTRQQEETISVAFSGGPDSTALLFLLKKLTSSNGTKGCKPSQVVAITVDHGLQGASSQMTEKCIAIAASLQVKHLVFKIPWGVVPFPTIPSKGSSFEKLAREARYHLLLSALKEEAISAIAFGHHADDQVETALLRIVRGSTEVGAAGMRPQRLWGMGFGSGPEELGWAGQHGMSRWIVRPLLHVPKERLIATCHKAKLDYVVDKTNSQPDIALRNRIRHQLGEASSVDLVQGTKALLEMAARLADSDGSTERTHDTHEEGSPTSHARLRSAVESISDFVENLNHEASIQLAKCMRPSPVSTILLSKDAFSRVTDNSVRLEIIRRVLRFVSPFPWGSPRAEAGRRTASLQRISDTLSISEGYSGKDGRVIFSPKKFVAGGGVVWSPVCTTRNAEIKFFVKGFPEFRGTWWLASRQPPIRRYMESESKTLELDITPSVLTAISQNCSAEILYDNRFLLHITPRLFPTDILDTLEQMAAVRGEVSADQALVKLLVISHTQYFLPKIVLRRTDAQAELLSSDGDVCSQGQENSREDDHEIARLLPDGSTRTQARMGENNKDGRPPVCNGEAVRIKYIRILDADISSEDLGQHSM